MQRNSCNTGNAENKNQTGPFAKRLALLAASLLLSACATAPQQPLPAPVPEAPPSAPSVSSAERETLRIWISQQERLYRVAAPLLTNNTALCKDYARPLLGFTAKNRYSYSADFTDAAHKILGLDERLQVMNILAGSGAAKAGMRRGDILLSAEEQPLPSGANAEREAAVVLAPLVSKRSSLQLEILRNGNPMTLNVPPTPACGFGIELGNIDLVGAYADGRRILLTRGMLNFVANDDELAAVMAREIAHNILGHPQKQRSSVAAGEMIDNLIRMHPERSSMSGNGGIRPMPQALDVAADRLALFLMARGGYNIGVAPALWQRLAAQYPTSVSNGYTALHPSTVARLAAIEKASADIKQKQGLKKPLLP